MRRFLVLVLAVAAARGTLAADRVIPVITGTIGDRTYRTTVDLRSSTTEECRFEFRAPGGATLYAVEPVEAGRPKLLDEFGLPVGATTIRVSCTGAVEVHSRIHESDDGGVTFDEGPLFEAAIPEPLAAGQKHAMPVNGDFILAEVHGAPARVVATLTATSSGRIAEKQYDLAPFEERSIGMTDVLLSLGAIDATFEIEGEGHVIVLAEVIDPAFANRARRASRLNAQTAVTPGILSSTFKAAPFSDPATDLVYLRNRWYDPNTGTFLTPDPLGYSDSSSLYTFAGGDPVNSRDPNGLAASVSKTGVIIGIRPDGSRYRIEPVTDPVLALRVLESDADLGFDEQEDILTRARMTVPYSSVCRLGESCIGSKAPNNRAYTHAPQGGGWGYAEGVAMAGANMLTGAGAALTRDPAYVGFEPKTREQQVGAGTANLTAAIVGTKAVFKQLRTARAQVRSVPEDPVPLVEATFEHAGTTYYDVNPTARGLMFRSHLEIEGLAGPNKTRANAHAEVSAMAQSLDAGNFGGSAVLRVRGLSACAYCKGSIKAMARKLGLEKLTVIDETTGQVYEFVGNELLPTPKGRGWKR